jgi:hypothetical protein
MMKKWLLSSLALAAILAWASPSQAALCFLDSKNDGTGTKLHWVIPTTGIPVKINDTILPADLKVKALEAITAAFKAYEDITCSNLKFDIKGSGSSTTLTWEEGAILVGFGDNTSVGGGSAYLTSLQMKPETEGEEIQYSYMLMNTQLGYTVGAEVKMIDIQTAVMQMIPAVIGYFTGDGDPHKLNLPEIKYNYVNHTVSQEQITGAQFLYYDANDGTGCVLPAAPAACMTLPAIDASISTKDGGTNPTGDGNTNPTLDSSSSTGDQGLAKDSGTKPPSGDDSGCCRVSHAQRTTGSAYLALAGVLIFLAFRRRRR